MYFFNPLTQASFGICLLSCLIDMNWILPSLEGEVLTFAHSCPASLDSLNSTAGWLLCISPALTYISFATSGHSRRFDFRCSLISFPILIKAPSQKGTICLCLCLTLGSVTCLALPAWLNTVPSFLFCSHLCPLLFDNPDRHARWVMRTCPSLFLCQLTSLHPSVREGSRCAHFLISFSDICLSILLHLILYVETLFFERVKRTAAFGIFYPPALYVVSHLLIFNTTLNKWDQNLLDIHISSGNLYMHICTSFL